MKILCRYCLLFFIPGLQSQTDSIVPVIPWIQPVPEIRQSTFLYFTQFRRQHWNLLKDSSNPNAVSFNSSTESQTGSIYSDIVTDYISNIKVTFATLYTIAPDDTSMAYHNLFNGGGNGIIKTSLPLVFAGSNKNAYKRFAGLFFAPKVGFYLPQFSGTGQDLQMNKDLGLELLFGITTDDQLITFSGSIRTAYSYGRNEYVSRMFTEGVRNFGYELLTLSLKIKQVSFSSRMPLRIWFKGQSIKNLPAFISLAVNY